MPCGTTLIVSPQSIAQQWIEEIEKHTEPGSLKVMVSLYLQKLVRGHQQLYSKGITYHCRNYDCTYTVVWGCKTCNWICISCWVSLLRHSPGDLWDSTYRILPCHKPRGVMEPKTQEKICLLPQPTAGCSLVESKWNLYQKSITKCHTMGYFFYLVQVCLDEAQMVESTHAKVS